MKYKKKVKRLDVRRRAWERELQKLNTSTLPAFKRPGSLNH